MSDEFALQAKVAPRFDVVVPIHNAVHVVRFCLSSLEQTCPQDSIRITCILDACDDHTCEVVKSWCDAAPNRRVIESEHNLGFVESCNLGMQDATADFVVLSNSDICATEGWPDGFAACFASDDRIAIASPLSNFCPHNSVPMQPGLTLKQMGAVVSARLPSYPDITTCEGFFFAMRRSAIEQFGFLDPVFGRGYCEESDLSLRANYYGWRTVLVDNCYIFHFGRESFGAATRKERYEKNKVVFFDRWGIRHSTDFEAMKKNDAITAIRQSLAGNPDLRPVTWVE